MPQISDILNNTIKSDRRFTVRPEYCGQRAKRFVARFCGEWIGQAKTRREARDLAGQWNRQRLAL